MPPFSVRYSQPSYLKLQTISKSYTETLFLFTILIFPYSAYHYFTFCILNWFTLLLASAHENIVYKWEGILCLFFSALSSVPGVQGKKQVNEWLNKWIKIQGYFQVPGLCNWVVDDGVKIKTEENKVCGLNQNNGTLVYRNITIIDLDALVYNFKESKDNFCSFNVNIKLAKLMKTIFFF
jgi:hypothetical protein